MKNPARRPVADNLPAGYQETMAWGMPSYVVPLERYPDTYNGQPLGYVSFAVVGLAENEPSKVAPEPNA